MRLYENLEFIVCDMADERLIPNRPNPDDSRIPAADKDLIVYSIAFAIPNQKAFALWHPEFLDSSGKLNKTGRAACTQFFNYSKNREYADNYAAYLKEFLSKKESGVKSETSAIIDDARKDNARVALYNKVIRLIEGDDELDPDTLKIAVDMAKKLSIVADDVEEQVIKPIRVLPERCGSCRMRIFTESMVSEGKVLDMCQWCKARKCAEEHGCRFNDGKDLLEIPKEVIDELESKNNVRMEDILSGRIEN